MCGIAGIWHFERERPVERDTLAWMAAVATLALVGLPTVRRWVADQQWARRYPGTTRPPGRRV